MNRGFGVTRLTTTVCGSGVSTLLSQVCMSIDQVNFGAVAFSMLSVNA